ncbi:acyltransferase ChoActase/COT/CPT [Punctularia strigosozonata HHB-11173 SS5]|uniref:acyltransferase ChoActase/COT/CPT n=1 Tax=Punctularia strigosozonata (strain HHB-11173) TaxID=741275 RepID=UPI0004416E32|nr:acyltransferase ChoActase/COT/CPT [Punctularia strigosozonata HHB-11173 SS5]EIN09804.1 acyltransferase ChoActase/COT/CPT [Punctularia strigosozonata HHB-11173 SS5]
MTTAVERQLPRLPVPPLQQTIDQYLKSMEPFLLEQEARGGSKFADARAHRVALAERFVTAPNEGPKLQALLVELDKKSPHNWLEDNYWTKVAYHRVRAPLLIHSNWWLALNNDPNIPELILRDGREDVTPAQVRRAAWLAHRLVEFKNRLCSSDASTRTARWLRDAALRIFHSYRVPRPECDAFAQAPSASSSAARASLVQIRNFCYAVEVTLPDGTPVPFGELERRLRRVVRDARQRWRRGERAVPVSVLSSDNRDTWAKNYQHLRDLSPQNAANLEIIHDALFAISLDAYTHIHPTPPLSSNPELQLNTRAELDAHLHNTRSGRGALNRWFDKGFTLIVESNTRAGVMGEHSPVDALAPSIVAEYALVDPLPPNLVGSLENEWLGDLDHSDYADVQGEDWTRLDWETDETIEQACAEAQSRAEAIIADSDDSVLHFSEYGADWIKSVARLSPDAYIQQALQLAFHAHRGTFTAVYETALTRLFDRGRTETIRAFTTDSRAFVLAMADPSSSSRTRLDLLVRAVQTHMRLTRAAATGKGIDRHLLGLELLARSSGVAPPALFADPVYDESKTWLLSTSGLSAGHLFRGTGFGAPYSDGYGINYLAGPDVLKIGVESKRACPSTSTVAFLECLRGALRSMRLVVEDVWPVAPAKL